MEKVRIYYDKEMKSLTVWFDDPTKEYICEEVGEGIVLMKDCHGETLGFEKLYAPLEEGVKDLQVELLTTAV